METKPEVGDVLTGRYELRALLGAGELGRVFAAWDRERRQAVTIKLFDLTAPAPEAFRRYAEAVRRAAAVGHPALVLPQPPASSGAPRFVVGEALKGVDLERLRAREGAVPWPRAAAIASTCADALAAVHAATGLAHRALKPSNVWISETSQARVLDFGVAELAVTPPAARAGPVFVEYRAPEQLEGEPGDARSDVYSLAVLLFELATGVHPFAGPSAFKAAHRALHPVALDTAALPAQARPLLTRALARRPEERFADAREFLRALTVVRQSVGHVVPRFERRAEDKGGEKEEREAPQPAPDPTTQIRVPVLRLRAAERADAPAESSEAGGAERTDQTSPLEPASAHGTATGEPPLLNASATAASGAQAATANDASSTRRADPPREEVARILPRGHADSVRPEPGRMPSVEPADPAREEAARVSSGKQQTPLRHADPARPEAVGQPVERTERLQPTSDATPPEPTLALPELPRRAERPAEPVPDDEAATRALPVFGGSRPHPSADGPAPELTLALPQFDPRAAHNLSSGPSSQPPEATLALPQRDPSAARNLSSGPSSQPPEATLALPQSDPRAARNLSSGPSSQPPEATLALPQSDPGPARGSAPDATVAATRPQPAETTLALPDADPRAPQDMAQETGTRFVHGTVVLHSRGSGSSAPNSPRPAPQPRATPDRRPAGSADPPAAPQPRLSHRAQVTLIIVLTTLILAALVVLLVP